MTETKDATTEITIHESGGFRRTALVISPDGAGGSVDVLLPDGTRLAQLNLFVTDDGTFMADVIDVDDRYASRTALTFKGGARHTLPADSVVGAHFVPETE